MPLLDLTDLLARLPDGDGTGPDPREDPSSQSPWWRMRDAHAAARDATRQAAIEPGIDLAAAWRAAADAALDVCAVARDLRVAATLTEALTWLHGVEGLIVGAELMAAWLRDHAEALHPRDAEEAFEDRLAILSGLASHSDTLSMALRAAPLDAALGADATPFRIRQLQRQSQDAGRAGMIAWAEIAALSAAARDLPPAAWERLREAPERARAAWRQAEEALHAHAGTWPWPPDHLMAALDDVRDVTAQLLAGAQPVAPAGAAPSDAAHPLASAVEDFGIMAPAALRGTAPVAERLGALADVADRLRWRVLSVAPHGLDEVLAARQVRRALAALDGEQDGLAARLAELPWFALASGAKVTLAVVEAAMNRRRACDRGEPAAGPSFAVLEQAVRARHIDDLRTLCTAALRAELAWGLLAALGHAPDGARAGDMAHDALKRLRSAAETLAAAASAGLQALPAVEPELLAALSGEAPPPEDGAASWGDLSVALDAALDVGQWIRQGLAVDPAPWWQEVERRARAVLVRFPHLDIAGALALARLHTGGVAGLAGGLALIGHLLRHHWSPIELALDPRQRGRSAAAALTALIDGPQAQVLEALRGATLAIGPDGTRLTAGVLEAVLYAEPRHPAAASARMSLEGAMRAAGPARLEAEATSCAAAREALRAVVTEWGWRLGGRPEANLDVAPLVSRLEFLEKDLRYCAALAAVGAPEGNAA